MNFAEAPKTHTTRPIYVGSSVIGMRYKNGLIIACDTRINYGSLAKFQNIDDRVQQINANTIMASSGEYSDFQEVTRTLKEASTQDYLEGKSYMGPKEFTAYLSSMHYYRRNKANPFWNSTVMGGINWDGQPVLYGLDQFGTLLSANYMMNGFAQYFCNSIIAPEYPSNPDDMSLDQAMALVRKCFEVLFYRDCGAGNRIKFGIMDNSTGEVKYEERFENLETKWEYERFRNQANEKIYLTN